MQVRAVHIIACFLLSLFVLKEAVAYTRLASHYTETGTDRDTDQENGSQKGFEKEEQLPAGIIEIAGARTICMPARKCYIEPYTPVVSLNIVTPPPEPA